MAVRRRRAPRAPDWYRSAFDDDLGLRCPEDRPSLPHHVDRHAHQRARDMSSSSDSAPSAPRRAMQGGRRHTAAGSFLPRFFIFSQWCRCRDAARATDSSPGAARLHMAAVDPMFAAVSGSRVMYGESVERCDVPARGRDRNGGRRAVARLSRFFLQNLVARRVLHQLGSMGWRWRGSRSR